MICPTTLSLAKSQTSWYENYTQKVKMIVQNAKTHNLPRNQAARIMIFIKPGDDDVFENFFVLLQSIEKLELKYDLRLDIVVDNRLNEQYIKAVKYQKKYKIFRELSAVQTLSDDIK